MKSRLVHVLALLLLVTCATDAQAFIGTVAGGGPNDLPATQANLPQPTGVAVDASGTFYLAAQGLHRVFKVDINGTLTVVAGNGTVGFSGDGGLATNASLTGPGDMAVDTAGNLFIADLRNHRIRKVVFDPITLMENLVETVMNLNLQQGIENSLDAKLADRFRFLA